MLEYKPFVRALEARRGPRSGLAKKEEREVCGCAVRLATGALRMVWFDPFGRDTLVSQLRNSLDLTEGSEAFSEVQKSLAESGTREPLELLWTVSERCVPADLPVEQFIEDWLREFRGEPPPYLGGLRSLAVYSVGSRDLVRIKEYEGKESIEADDSWL